MYYYIYDEFVQDKKYEREVLKIENRLTDLGIYGKVARLALFKHADELVRDEVKRGVKTVVVIGNDRTLSKVLDVVAELGVTVGIIPLGTENHVADLLGIPEGIAACDVLSTRIIETVDVGTLNGKRFLTSVMIPKTTAEITCEGNYSIRPTIPGSIEICNMGFDGRSSESVRSNPKDGVLDTVIKVMTNRGGKFIKKMKMGKTTLALKSLAIRSIKPIKVYADGAEIEGTDFTIGLEPLNLKVITGKTRQF